MPITSKYKGKRQVELEMGMGNHKYLYIKYHRWTLLVFTTKLGGTIFIQILPGRDFCSCSSTVDNIEFENERNRTSRPLISLKSQMFMKEAFLCSWEEFVPSQGISGFMRKRWREHDSLCLLNWDNAKSYVKLFYLKNYLMIIRARPLDLKMKIIFNS